MIRWMAATLDGIVEGTGAVYEAKFMLPWSFSDEAAGPKAYAGDRHWATLLRDMLGPSPALHRSHCLGRRFVPSDRVTNVSL